MRRYICDSLYGIIYLPDYVWEVLPSPELQRLREIRLCNINSFCLTGGANINRYEHAIGTCYLALECLRNWPPLNPVSEKESKQLVLAALLHDVLNAPFGHSIQYAESKLGYKPERHFPGALIKGDAESYIYRESQLESVFFGMPSELIGKLKEEDLFDIGKTIAGEGRFGPLINGSIDLDNIDNVFRFSFHLGLIKSGTVALNLARSLWLQKNELFVKDEALPYVEQWYETRRKLYAFLLLNPEEFSAKCMLNEAFEFAKDQSFPFRWYDTDYEFLKKLDNVASVKEEVIESLFEVDANCRSALVERSVSMELREQFGQNGHELSTYASVVPDSKGWRLVDKAKTYFIDDEIHKLKVYKIIPRVFEVRATVRRLMKGDLYGCIGIFSSGKTELKSIFKQTTERRRMENHASEIIRKLRGRFSKAIVVFHLIEDINKTERRVVLRTSDGSPATVGESSHRLLIGAFFRNPNLSVYRIDLHSDDAKKVRNELRSYLSSALKDTNLEELELYQEAALHHEKL